VAQRPLLISGASRGSNVTWLYTAAYWRPQSRLWGRAAAGERAAAAAAAAIQPTVEKRAVWNLCNSGCGYFSFMDHIADTRVYVPFPTPLNFHILGGLGGTGTGNLLSTYADLHCWKRERICRGRRLIYSTSIKSCIIERRGPLAHNFPAQSPTHLLVLA